MKYVGYHNKRENPRIIYRVFGLNFEDYSNLITRKRCYLWLAKQKKLTVNTPWTLK